MPREQREGSIHIHRCLALHPNFLKRTEYFSSFLTDLLDRTPSPPQTIHFRDIFSGVPMLMHPLSETSKIIYEVNALSSIELPIHYPKLYNYPKLLERFRKMEEFCLSTADVIITVSEVTRRYLQRLGIEPDKIHVIPNAADTDTSEPERPKSEKMILYVGTLTPWQGVHVLLKAFALMPEDADIRLTMACSSKKFLRPLRKMIKQEKLEDRVDIRIGLPQPEVKRLYRKALFSVAPLTRCDRNELQGCCPIKIVESMAAGAPVIASNIAVCRELIEHETDGFLFEADSVRSLAAAMTRFISAPEFAHQMGRRAKEKVNSFFGIDRFIADLSKAYDA